MKITTTHTSNSPVTFVTHTHFAVLLFLAVLLRKLTIIAIWTQCNMIGSMQPWGVIQKAIPMLKLCKNFHGLMQKVLQSVEEFVPNRVNEVLVLISLESRCFARFRPGEHDVSKTSTPSLFLLCFRKEYFVFFTKLYILFQNAGYIIVYFLY